MAETVSDNFLYRPSTPLTVQGLSGILQHMASELLQLMNSAGQRLYLTAEERALFLTFAEKEKREIRTFCYVMAYTGCRISEALELTADRIDLERKCITLRTLKKKKDKKTRESKIVHRTVPVPPHVLDALNLVHNIREAQADRHQGRRVALWPWGRTTGWRHVCRIMRAAGIKEGPHRSPKGLRHSFGVNAIEKGIPLNMLQKWMGHSQMETTAIYANAMGAEEQTIAARMWT